MNEQTTVYSQYILLHDFLNIILQFLQPVLQGPENFCTPPGWAAQVNLWKTGEVWQLLCHKTDFLFQPYLGSSANSGDVQNKIIFLRRVQTKFEGGQNYQGN